MAFYVPDELRKILCTKESIDIISQYLYEMKGYMPVVEIRNERGVENILIQTYVGDRDINDPNWWKIVSKLKNPPMSNTVGLSETYGYINPCYDKKGDIMTELADFVIKVAPNLILQRQREERINSILLL